MLFKMANAYPLSSWPTHLNYAKYYSILFYTMLEFPAAILTAVLLILAKR